MAKPLRLAGAIAALISLWMPWYELRLGALRSTLDGQVSSLPGGFGEFARGLLSALPTEIRVTGWQAFNGADVAIAMLAGALALSYFMVVDRRLLMALALALMAIVVVHVVDLPGPSGIAGLRGGAWVALAGALAALAAGLLDSDARTDAAAGDWTQAPAAGPAAAPASVPPPG